MVVKEESLLKEKSFDLFDLKMSKFGNFFKWKIEHLNGHFVGISH